MPDASWTHAPAAIGGLLVLLLLSPEIEEAVARLRYRAPCEQRPLDAADRASRLRVERGLAVARRLLLGTDAGRQLAGAVLAILRLPGAHRAGDAVDVVFAVYLTRAACRRPGGAGRRRRAAVEAEPLPESIPVSA